MREFDQPQFTPGDIPKNWKVPGMAIHEYNTVNQLDINSGFLSIQNNSFSGEPITREYFFNDQGTVVNSIFKKQENTGYYLEAAQIKGPFKTTIAMGYHVSTIDYNSLTGGVFNESLGKILYFNNDASISNLIQIRFGRLMHPTSTDTIPDNISLHQSSHKNLKNIGDWEPVCDDPEAVLEKLDEGKYLITAEDKKEYVLSWKVNDEHLLASLTNNTTGATKFMEAAHSFNTASAQKLLMAEAPYPKDESGLLNVPWTRAINLFPARLAYLQPRPEQETPDSN